MNLNKIVCFASLLSLTISAGAETYSVTSPDGLNEIRLTTEPTLAYQVLRGGTALTEPSAIALEVAGKPLMGGAFRQD